MRMVVVFPAPFGPRSPNTSPRSMVRSRWSTAVMESKARVRAVAWTRGSYSAGGVSRPGRRADTLPGQASATASSCDVFSEPEVSPSAGAPPPYTAPGPPGARVTVSSNASAFLARALLVSAERWGLYSRPPMGAAARSGTWLRGYLVRVRLQHERDLGAGAGWVEVPHELGRKYPN